MRFDVLQNNYMPQDNPRIAKGFRAEVFLKVLGLFLFPFGAMIIGAYRSQGPPNEDLIQLILKGIVLVGGLVWLMALPYFFMVVTPKCELCKVRTRRKGKMKHDNDEWKLTICPLCHERYMHRMFGADPS